MKKVIFMFFVTMNCMAATSLKIKIGTEGAYEPFNYIDQKGEIKGFDIDIAKEICKEIKADCQFVTQAWDGIIPGLLYRKYDAIVASMSITKKRAKKVLFSIPYYSSPARFMLKKDTAFELSRKWMENKKIGVQRGTIHVNYLEGEWKKIVEIKEYDTLENANSDLVSGRLDAVLADATVLYDWVQKNSKGAYELKGPGLKDPRYFGVGAGIAFRKKDKKLAKLFNDAIVKIKKNGRYKAINKKYFPFDI